MFQSQGYFRIISCQSKLLLPNISSSQKSANSTLLCVKSGCVQIRIEGDSLTLHQGAFVLISANTTFSFFAPYENTHIFALSIDDDILPDTTAVLNDAISLGTICKNDLYTARFCDLAFHYYHASNGYSVLNAVNDYMKETASTHQRQYMLNLLSARLIMEIAYQIAGSDFRPKTLPLNLANQYIRTNLAENIHASDIADACNVSVSYLQKLFHDEYGHGIVSHVISIHLEQACQLLQNTDRPIVDIADATGFNSRQHFTHTFKKHYDMSPLQYRTMYKNT